MLRYASVTFLAMLAPKWHTNHALHAIILFVKLPQTQKLVDDGLLFSKASKLRNIARFIEHGREVEICA